MFSSPQMALGTLTPSMRNSSSMPLTPSLTFPGSNSNATHVKRLICSRSLACSPPSLDAPITQARLASVLHLLSLLPQCYVVASLISMPSYPISDGWGETASMTLLGKPPSITRLTSVSRYANIFVPVSPLPMFVTFRNGTQPIRLFPTSPLMTMGSLGMVGAASFRFTEVSTLSSLPVTPCPPRPSFPQP